MNWQLWVVAGVHVLGLLVTVGTVGKERKPIDGTTAVISVVLNTVLVSLIVWGASA